MCKHQEQVVSGQWLVVNSREPIPAAEPFQLLTTNHGPRTITAIADFRLRTSDFA